MAKAKLRTLTKDWVDGKKEKRLDAKTAKNQEGSSIKVQKTLYISKEANKLLWYTRAETGRTLSDTIESLILTHLERK